ncbi:MAG: nitrilase-related carbon-nitrogen hydrolase [bacterium]|nr:nitrilase-related carbon-nitrogen hydrolase [bacterium]
MRPATTVFSHPLFLVFASSALYIVSYDMPAYAWPLGLVALVPFFFFLYNEQSVKRLFWYGFLFGTVIIAGTTVWFLSTYPLEWAGIGNRFVAGIIVLAVWTATSVILGLFFAFFSVLFKKLVHHDWRDLLLVPSLWVLMEFSRALALSAFFLGNQSSLGPDWIFGFFGYSLVWSPLLARLAPWGGVYLLSFIGVAINYAFFLALRQMRGGNKAKMVFLTAGALIVVISAGQLISLIQTQKISGETATVAIITTNFPAAFMPGFLSIGEQSTTIERLLDEAMLSSPDIIVLPEDSRALSYLGTTTVERILNREDKEVLLIDSGPVPDPSGTRERIFFYSSSRGIIGTSDKAFLMPYGEYLPQVAVTTANLFGLQEWLSAFQDSRGYQKGENAIPVSFRGHMLGALFCSEIIPESPYRSLANDGAEIFFNIASHADFHTNEKVLYNQTLSLAKMKSASNGRFFIQAGNYMPSFFLNEHGDILGESARGENSVLLAEVGFNTRKTFYTRRGDWILLIAILVVTFSAQMMLQRDMARDQSRANR